MVRVAIGGLEHETNTYATQVYGPTSLDAFSQQQGEKLMHLHRAASTPLGGFISCGHELGYEVVPTFFAMAEPSGIIETKTYDFLKKRLVDSIIGAMPVDAVALDLHGAGVSEQHEDIESDIGRAIRDAVGPDVPIVCSLDLHGNIYDTMCDVFDVMIGYRLYPHEDQWETGYKAFSLVPNLLRGERFHVHLERLPMLLPTVATDKPYPHFQINQLCEQIENTQAGVLDLRLFHGFPFTDIAHPSPVVMCTVKSDNKHVASLCARRIATRLWEIKNEFLTIPSYSPLEAVAKARNHIPANGPVVIHETSDNPGCGGVGDATHLLRAVLDASVGRDMQAVFGFFCDAQAVQDALKIGVGNTGDISLGGKTGVLHGAPLNVRCVVKLTTNGKYTLEKYAPGVKVHAGPTVLLSIDNIDVIVVSKRCQTFDTVPFRLHNIDVSRYDLVCLKSSIHFRAGFRQLANGFQPEIITCDAPGLTSNKLETFSRQKCLTALWPIDPDVSYNTINNNNNNNEQDSHNEHGHIKRNSKL